MNRSEPGPSVRLRRKSRGGAKLREASFDDYEQIALLESRHGFPDRSRDKWAHLWLGNPLYRELDGRWIIGWVLEDADHRVVGSIGNIPLLYEFEGRRVITAASRFWVADPEYRGAALLLLDRVINQPQIDLWMSNTVTPQGMEALEGFPVEPVPAGLWNESACWVTREYDAVERLLGLEPAPGGQPGGPPVADLEHAMAAVMAGGQEVVVTPCSGFDERFEAFWTESKRREPHLLWAVRSREVLEWHYANAWSSNQLWVATVIEGRRLVAYATFDRRDDPKASLKRVRLVDFQALEGGTALLRPMLAWALRRCQNEGIHVLESVGRWLKRGELLDVLAPYRRKLPIWGFIYRALNADLAARLTEERVWAPSLFDSDASLGWC